MKERGGGFLILSGSKRQGIQGVHNAGGHQCGAVSWLRADQLVINADEFHGQWLGVLPDIYQGSWTSTYESLRIGLQS